MFTYKLLTNNDIESFKIFYDTLSQDINYKWQLDLALRALKDDIPEIYVAAELKDNLIVSVLLGYTVNKAFELLVFYENFPLTPYWIMGLWVSNQVEDKLPHNRYDILTTLLSDTFKSLGMESFYVARKASDRVNYDNAYDYVKRFNRTEQYEPVVEQIYYHNTYDNNSLNYLYRITCHKVCEPGKSIILIKYLLKPKYRITK